MNNVPTWADLRIEASWLEKAQRQCYSDVHQLLNFLPELDRKLSLLNNTHFIQPPELAFNYQQPAPVPIVEPNRIPDPSSRTPATFNQFHAADGDSIPKARSDYEISKKHENHAAPVDQQRELGVVDVAKDPTPPPLITRTITKSRSQPMCLSPPNFGPQDVHKKQKARQEQPKPAERVENELDLDQLEHLKPLPMLPSEYLKRNRPDVVYAADERVKYLKHRAERRKQDVSEKIANSLEEMRMSSRMNSGVNRTTTKTRNLPIKNSMSHDYHVKCDFTEKEMRRLTAKTYKRLPEVKKREDEETNKYMRVQNYKNKLEYGRKLQENLRMGKINYRLRSSIEDASILDSQDDSLNGGGSADAFSSEPYYKIIVDNNYESFA